MFVQVETRSGRCSWRVCWLLSLARLAFGGPSSPEAPWEPLVCVVRVRMGLHPGTPQGVGNHYVGLDMHRAARLAASGHGGPVLRSQTTRSLVDHPWPEGVTLPELGAPHLKDLQPPERLTQLVLPALPADSPRSSRSIPTSTPCPSTPPAGPRGGTRGPDRTARARGRVASDTHRVSWHRQDAPGRAGGR